MRRETSPEERALEELRRLKKRPPSRREKRALRARYIAAVLLALLCVGGAELAACRHFEPALYESIMAPVREKGLRAAQAAGQTLGAVRQGTAALAERTGEAVFSAGQSLRAWMEREPPPETETDSALAQPEIAPPREILDPLISDLIDREGQEILTGGSVEVVYFNQTDEAREDQMYGTDPLSTHGCGPTAMAMAVSSLTGETVDPEDMAKLCVEAGYWCKSHGSYLSMVQGVAEAYGLGCESLDVGTLEAEELYERLIGGDIAVALMTKGHFTKGGHFILLRGTTLGGEVLVADPASRERSLIPWDPALILEELSPSRHDGAPLWLLCADE